MSNLDIKFKNDDAGNLAMQAMGNFIEQLKRDGATTIYQIEVEVENKWVPIFFTIMDKNGEVDRVEFLIYDNEDQARRALAETKIKRPALPSRMTAMPIA